jgi:hypothetical protein
MVRLLLASSCFVILTCHHQVSRNSGVRSRVKRTKRRPFPPNLQRTRFPRGVILVGAEVVEVVEVGLGVVELQFGVVAALQGAVQMGTSPVPKVLILPLRLLSMELVTRRRTVPINSAMLRQRDRSPMITRTALHPRLQAGRKLRLLNLKRLLRLHQSQHLALHGVALVPPRLGVAILT